MIGNTRMIIVYFNGKLQVMLVGKTGKRKRVPLPLPLTMVDDVKKLTLEEVSDAFRKYINNIVWVYQGDPKKVNQVLYINGTLNKGDNPVSH